MDDQIRRMPSTPQGTFGVILQKGIPTYISLEPENPIPAGIYTCVRYFSPKHQRQVYLLKDVPGHEGVELHIGNTFMDTELCILVGMGIAKFSHDVIEKIPASLGIISGISYSRVAFNDFMNKHTGDFQLEIIG